MKRLPILLFCGFAFARANQDDPTHKAVCWLTTAQDATPNGGFSAYYRLYNEQWAASYPEVTGYLIPTLIAVGYPKERIKAALDWLVSLQHEQGWFPAGLADGRSPTPSLFNTGQVLDGLLSGGNEYRGAASAAARWMARTQHPDGTWPSELLSDNNCRTYNARAAWQLGKVFPKSAARFLNWSLSYRKQGWLRRTEFLTKNTAAPYWTLHSYAYAVEGLLGISPHSPEVLDLAKAMLRAFERDSMLFDNYSEPWVLKEPFSVSLTGLAQTGVIFGRCYVVTGEIGYLKALKEINLLLSVFQRADGGWIGSIPPGAPYKSNQVISWGAKFALDSFLIERKIREGE